MGGSERWICFFFVFLSSSSSFSSVGFWSLGFEVSSGLTVMEIRWKMESERGNACFFFLVFTLLERSE